MSQTGRPRNAGIACTQVSQGTLELRTHFVYQSITSRKISLFSKWRVQSDDTHTLSLSHSDTTLDVSRTGHCDLHQWQSRYQLILICCSVTEAAKKRHFFHDIFLSPLLNFLMSATLAATGAHLFFQVRRQSPTHLKLFQVRHTGRDRCTLQVRRQTTHLLRHTGRNSSTPFPFAPFC